MDGHFLKEWILELNKRVTFSLLRLGFWSLGGNHDRQQGLIVLTPDPSPRLLIHSLELVKGLARPGLGEAGRIDVSPRGMLEEWRCPVVRKKMVRDQ
jgi:hypothetical protein